MLLTGAYPFYSAIGSESASLLTLFAIAGFAAAFTNGTFASIMADLFPARVRFSGVIGHFSTWGVAVITEPDDAGGDDGGGSSGIGGMELLLLALLAIARRNRGCRGCGVRSWSI